MSGIAFSGLASGLDTESIITSLMAVEKQGRARLTNDQTAITARQTGLRSVQTQLNNVKLAADDLKSVVTWLDKQTVESTGNAVAAKLTAGAGPGGYDVVVTQLASAERRTYGFTPSTGAQTLTVNGKDGTARASIELKADATLQDAVLAINSSDTAGIFAAAVDGQLVLSSKSTGADGAFSLAGAGAQTAVVAGANAQGTINGVAFDSSSNTLRTAVPGLEVTLKAKTTGTGLTVTEPQPDTDAVKTKLKAFVDTYNKAVDSLRTTVNEKRVPGAASATDLSKGQLFGDATVSGALSAMRTMMSETVSGLTGLTRLSDVGVAVASATGTTSADAKAGKLVFDEAKFNEAMAANPDGVQKLLAGSDTVKGFGAKLSALLDPYAGKSGLLQTRMDQADREITGVKDKLDAFDTRMELREATLRKQFTALETALSRSQSLQSSMAAQLGS